MYGARERVWLVFRLAGLVYGVARDDQIRFQPKETYKGGKTMIQDNLLQESCS